MLQLHINFPLFESDSNLLIQKKQWQKTKITYFSFLFFRKNEYISYFYCIMTKFILARNWSSTKTFFLLAYHSIASSLELSIRRLFFYLWRNKISGKLNKWKKSIHLSDIPMLYSLYSNLTHRYSFDKILQHFHSKRMFQCENFYCCGNFIFFFKNIQKNVWDIQNIHQ